MLALPILWIQHEATSLVCERGIELCEDKPTVILMTDAWQALPVPWTLLFGLFRLYNIFCSNIPTMGDAPVVLWRSCWHRTSLYLHEKLPLNFMKLQRLVARILADWLTSPLLQSALLCVGDWLTSPLLQSALLCVGDWLTSPLLQSASVSYTHLTLPTRSTV